MQVTNVEADPTHIILGGNNEITEFGISNDPAFFKILSSSLYSNQILAVVREVICNAWDAHIAADKEDTPIDISLTSQNGLSIRDYGHGIPHHLIGPIYTIYGGSTKKHDGAQTGGFGLGCKAPFAYTDTFSVDSYNEGNHASYVMGFSSGEGNGRPTAHTLFVKPTEQTGLEVNIPVKAHDVTRFEKHIRSVVYLGGIKAKLDDELLPTIDYTKAKEGFVFLRQTGKTPINIERTIHPFVRYGNVLYPIVETQAAPKVSKYFFQKIKSLLDRVGMNQYSGHGSMIILLAEPDTISVTPSREALSYQDNTIQTINKLLSDFVDRIKEHGPKTLFSAIEEEMVVEAENLYWTQRSKNYLFEEDLPFIFTEAEQRHYNDSPLTEMLDLGILSYSTRGYRTIARAKSHQVTRINRFIDFGMCAKSLQKDLKQITKAKDIEKPVIDYLNKYVKRVYKDLVRMQLNFSQMSWGVLGDAGKYTHQPLSELGCYHRNNYLRFMHTATKVVVIGNRVNTTHDRLILCKEHRPEWGIKEHLFYRVSRASKELDTAIAQFKRMGYTVVNMFERFSWENPPVKKIATNNKTSKTSESKVVFSTKGGVPLVSNIVDNTVCGSGSLQFDGRPIFEKNAKKTTTPAWIVTLPRNVLQEIQKNGKPYVGSFLGETVNNVEFAAIWKAFGDCGAICSTTSQQQYFLQNGAMQLFDYMLSEFLRLASVNPLFKEFMQLQHSIKRIRELRGQALVDFLIENESLSQILKIPKMPVFVPGSKEDLYAQVYCLLLRRQRSSFRTSTPMFLHMMEVYDQDTYDNLMQSFPKKDWQIDMLETAIQHYKPSDQSVDQSNLDQIIQNILKA